MNIQNLAGQVLGQYELREVLGFGGMGVAYKGYQRSLEREVAIKVLTPGLVSEPGFVERFYREAKTAASLEHAHIVPIYDYGVQGDISYVVMRLLTGGTLEDRLAQAREQARGAPSLGEIGGLLRELASALDYAHSRGIVHRDIKPSNIMFDEQGVAYVVDFGIAKMIEATTSYTASGTPLGTPMFMPPEQWRSEELTPAADQYALGVTIYALVTGGNMPFQATTPFGLLHKHLNEDPTPPTTYRPDMSRAVTLVLEQAMAKDPAARYPSVTAMADAFDEATRSDLGQKTGFFTAPVLTRKSVLPGPGASTAQIVSIDPSRTATLTESRPVYRSPVVWVLFVMLIAAVVALGFLLTQGDDESSAPPVSAAEIRQTLLAESTATADARTEVALAIAELATEEAAHATGTADAWTDTPPPTATVTLTPTLEPTATHTPTLTPTPDPTGTPKPTTPSPGVLPPPTRPGAPPGPAGRAHNLRAMYSDAQFVLVNTSTGTLDISELVFVQESPGGAITFEAEAWDQGALRPTTRMGPGSCYQLVAFDAAQTRPSTVDCPTFRGWFQPGPDDEFWVADEGATTFQVRVAGEDEPLAACQIAAGECVFTLPPP